MRVPSSPRQSRLQINMAPMIDVVFLLIIFFLVSSHLAKQEVQAKMSLPAAESGKQRIQTTNPRITINVVPESGSYTVKLGATPVAIGDLATHLRRELGRKGADLEVRIRADRTTPYRVIEPLLTACATCAQPGIWNVKFAVVRKEVEESVISSR